MAPVGQLSRHPARTQCLHTSEENSQENAPASCVESGTGRSMNATCRHVDAPSATVLSYDMPVNIIPSSGSWFHCLQATSQALQPMHRVVSVKKPLRGERLDVSSRAAVLSSRAASCADSVTGMSAVALLALRRLVPVQIFGPVLRGRQIAIRFARRERIHGLGDCDVNEPTA